MDIKRFMVIHILVAIGVPSVLAYAAFGSLWHSLLFGWIGFTIGSVNNNLILLDRRGESRFLFQTGNIKTDRD